MWVTVCLLAAVVVLVLGTLLWRSQQSLPGSVPFAQAKRRFHTQREGLEAKFIRLASSRLGPEAPSWTDCSFADDVAYVRSRTTGELSAFVAVTVETEGEADPLDDFSGVGPGYQAGTAVFRFDGEHWETDGQALLNVSPSEAVHRYRTDLEIVGEELAHP